MSSVQTLYHSINYTGWVSSGFPYWMIIIPSILGSIIPQLVINQQGFWTLLHVTPHESRPPQVQDGHLPIRSAPGAPVTLEDPPPPRRWRRPPRRRRRAPLRKRPGFKQHNKGGGGSIHGGTPKWMVYFMENPTKMDDDWGYPHGLGNLRISDWATDQCVGIRHVLVNIAPFTV